MADANLVFGLNSYRELCGLHFGGVTMTSSQLLLKCATRGAKHAMYVVNQIKDSLRRDEELRAKGQAASFTECVRLNRITSLAQDRLAIRLKRFKMGKSSKNEAASDSDDEEAGEATVKQELVDDDEEMDGDDGNVLVSLNKTSAALVPQKPKWVPESDFENSDDEEDEEEEDKKQEAVVVERKAMPKNEAKKLKPGKGGSKAKSREAMSTDSEEEDTIVMASAD